MKTKMKMVHALAALASGLACSAMTLLGTAQAAEATLPAASPSTSVAQPSPAFRFYLGAELGAAPVSDLTEQAADSYAAAYGATGTVKQDGAAAGGRLFAGWNLSENIALELGASTLSANLTAEGHIAGDSFKDSYDSSWRTLDYSLLLRPNASSRQHGFFARAGGHATTNTLKNKWTGDAWAEEGSSSKTQTKSGLLLGLGYDLFMGKRKAHVLRFSYTHYDNVPDLTDDLDVGDGFLKNNTLDVFRFGYFYRF